MQSNSSYKFQNEWSYQFQNERSSKFQSDYNNKFQSESANKVQSDLSLKLDSKYNHGLLESKDESGKSSENLIMYSQFLYYLHETVLAKTESDNQW